MFNLNYSGLRGGFIFFVAILSASNTFSSFEFRYFAMGFRLPLKKVDATTGVAIIPVVILIFVIFDL